MDVELLSGLPPGLKAKVETLAATHPPAIPVINGLLVFHHSTALPASSPPSKKRKLDPPHHSELGQLSYTICNVSFSSPARKKFDLQLSTSGLALVNPTTGAIDHSFPRSSISCAMCLPTANKVKAHHTVCILPSEGDAAVFGFDEDGAGFRVKEAAEEKEWVLGKGLSARTRIAEMFEKASDITWMEPDPRIFRAKSKAGQPYVGAYMGTKDGSLYFFPAGILFGFKKPIIFVPHADIANLEIVNLTGRTFSLLLERRSGETHEFSMIDATDVEPVASYIEYQQAAARKQAFNANLAKNGHGAVEGTDAVEGALEAMDEDDSDDEDFHMDESDDDVHLAEEYDSGHNTDSAPSENGGEESGEEDSEEEADEDKERDDKENGDSEDDATVAPTKIRTTGQRSARVSGAAMKEMLEAATEALGLADDEEEEEEEEEDEEDEEEEEEEEEEDEEEEEEEEEEKEEEQPAEKPLTGMKAIAAQIEKERKARELQAKQGGGAWSGWAGGKGR
ncbi:hypothetical protein HK104_009726 [Borealophlyctis nickersoniae]|nr:hypothetical protein HK104_009726 [Borealophlyctis nickersoniae]